MKFHPAARVNLTLRIIYTQLPGNKYKYKAPSTEPDVDGHKSWIMGENYLIKNVIDTKSTKDVLMYWISAS